MDTCPSCQRPRPDALAACPTCTGRGRVIGRIYPGPAGTKLVIDEASDGLTITLIGAPKPEPPDKPK